MVTQAGQIDTSIDIVTPENIAFQYRVAGPYRRVPAFLIDLCIRGLVMIAFALVIGFLGFLGAFGVGAGLLLVVWFVLEWFYGGLFEAYWNGQTPGKRLTGLRVLRLDGRPVTPLQAVMRNIFRVVDMMPFFTFVVGAITSTLNARSQRLGDLVCGTIVVVEDRTWLFGVSQIEDPRVEQLAAYIPANFQFTRTLRRAIATYVERRKFFSAPRRWEIARHIAQPLSERFHLPADTSYDLLMCALYHRAFLVDRQEDAWTPEAAPALGDSS